MKVRIKKSKEPKVHIHDHDIWSMDYTLSLIIVPMLKKLRKQNIGGPIVDNDDVIPELYTTEEDDSNYFKKWYYVLDEMIWAFEQISNDEDEDQFHSGEVHIQRQPLDKENNPIGTPFEIGDEEHEKGCLYQKVKGENDTSVFDIEGYNKHQARIDNGTRLFGKYYRALWI